MHNRTIQPMLLAAALFAGQVVSFGNTSYAQVMPPSAERIPRRLEIHGDVRVDNYYWLRDRDNPKVLEYLNAENRYYEAVTAHTKPLREKLFEEIKGRVKETDMSVPVRRRDFVYFVRTEEGKQYPIYCRRKVDDESSEQVMLDVNTVAEGHPFCSVRPGDVSFGQDILPFAVDTVGRRFYTIRFKNLTSGQVLPDVIENVTGNVAWARDNRTLFYTKQHPETLRPYQVYRHVLGTDPQKDQLVYEEADDTFTTFVFQSRSKRYVMIGSEQTLSSEYRYLDADEPMGRFTVFLPRQRNHEYSLDHHDGKFYVRTNRNATNFRLMSTPETATAEANWKDVVPHRDDVFLEGYTLFDNYLVVQERREGLTHLRIQPWTDDAAHYLQFDEPAYVVYPHANPEPDSVVLRFGYSSLTTPQSVYDYDMTTREKTLLKREEVLGDFDPENYRTERVYATARDGERVPVSLVYRKQLRQSGKNPLLLYGYGSYGISTDPMFRSEQLSLLDRGFVFAIAHVRGGQELGRRWYDNGKLLKKKNTFTDFIDVADHLVETGYAEPGHVYAMGGSAGGLLMGAVANMRPDRFRGIIAHVPFVDVVTTMLDESIPLTTNEYDEWGNPNEKPYYDYIRSYSPYDNVVSQDYPSMLVTTGLHDSQVQYWEPAKWVAKLRQTKTDHNLLLLKTEMEAGHGGPTGRYRRYREIAVWWAFLLDLEGIAAEPVTLFDGKTLDGWDVIGCEAIVRNGAILLKSGNGLVQAKQRYKDFVLEYEWKALNPELWDSGLYFRYDTVPPGRPWPRRFQVNLRKGMEGDIDGFANGKNNVATKPGEWNKFELTVKGNTASLKVNGKPSWTVDGIRPDEGRLAIQSEVPGGGQFLFRNIRITVLDGE